MMLAKLLVTTFLCWSSGQSGSMVTSTADVYAKCTENEERFCQKGFDQFHHCTAVSINTIKPSLESPQTPKIVCECQGGFTTPFLQAYEEAFVPTQQCIPCQEERTVYHGSDLKDADPIHQSMSFDDCISACYETHSCNFWSYDTVDSSCYLKTRRGSGPSRDENFVSGVKNCSAPVVFKESLERSSVLPVVEIFHPTGESSVLQGVAAMFGPNLVGNFSLFGTLSGSDLEDLFCEKLPEFFVPKGEFAIIRRGNCPFLRKIQTAQMAGFKGVIILDDKSDRKFHRIVADKSDLLKASFIKIPTIFLRVDETQIFEDLLQTGNTFLAKLSGSDQFSPHHDGSGVKFPEVPADEATHRRNQSSPDVFNPDHAITTVIPEIRTKAETHFSPVAIVIIIATSGLILLAILFSVGFCCIRILRSSGPRSSCPSSVGSNGSGTICQTITPNAGSLESLTRWIGADTFQAAGSDTPEMAVILSTLECPVCFELIWPPKKIFQCSKGHIICEICLTNTAFDKRCPSCRENFTSNGTSRNLALENLFANMLELVKETRETPAEVQTPASGQTPSGSPAANTRSSRTQITHFRYLPSDPTREIISCRNDH